MTRLECVLGGSDKKGNIDTLAQNKVGRRVGDFVPA